MVAGTILPSEAKLTAQFGVSRPVIREALTSLEARGIVKVLNGKGAIVQPVTSAPLRAFFETAVQLRRETLVELLEIRKGIEVQSASLAADRRTAEDVDRMQQTITAMRRHLHDPGEYVDLDANFHLLIAAASGNSMLHHLIESIRGPLKNSIREGVRLRHTEDQFQEMQGGHERILEAIGRSDAVTASRLMADHFDGAVKAMVGDALTSAAGSTSGAERSVVTGE